jgi:hypothetical protein
MKLVGASFRIFDASEQLVGLCDQAAFKLKEDIRIYADETKTREILVIKARTILDFSAAYDIWDVSRGLKVGALRRKGMRSILRDEWEVLDPQDNVIGKLFEDSMGMALLRRFLSNLIPQNFDMTMNDGRRVVDYRQAFNPFFYSLTVDFEVDPSRSLDPAMGIAAGCLIACIEGRQS